MIWFYFTVYDSNGGFLVLGSVHNTFSDLIRFCFINLLNSRAGEKRVHSAVSILSNFLLGRMKDALNQPKTSTDWIIKLSWGINGTVLFALLFLRLFNQCFHFGKSAKLRINLKEVRVRIRGYSDKQNL